MLSVCKGKLQGSYLCPYQGDTWGQFSGSGARVGLARSLTTTIAVGSGQSLPSACAGRYSEDQTYEGPAYYAASQAFGISSEKMLSHLGIAPKIAPAYDGTTSWFECEQLIDDWCDITTLDEKKRGPSLKTRLRLATVQKEALEREKLISIDGVE